MRVVLGGTSNLFLQTGRSGCLARSAVSNLLRAAEFAFGGRTVRKPVKSRPFALSVLSVVHGIWNGSGPAWLFAVAALWDGAIGTLYGEGE